MLTQRYADTFAVQMTYSASVCVTASHHCFLLSGSIMLCYFIALASVYGNSVSLLRQQLKMASSFNFLSMFYFYSNHEASLIQR